MSFFRNREQERKTGPIKGVGSSGRGKDVKKGYRRENVVEILYTYV
jgi:hypothetical protein